MPRKPKERGRPIENPLPPKVDATAEEMARALFALPANHQWEYQKAQPVYRCSVCEQEISYPKTLYRDGRCETCHKAQAS